MAIREGQAFAQTEFYDRPTRFDHEMVASAVFSQPPIGSVGLSEADARHLGGKLDIYLARFRAMKTTFVGGDERCLMKLVVDAATDKILGCHVVGPDSPEIIQMAAVALKMGVTKAQWEFHLRGPPDAGGRAGDHAREARAPRPRPGRGGMTPTGVAPARDRLSTWCGWLLVGAGGGCAVAGLAGSAGLAVLVAAVGLLALPAVRMTDEDRPALMVLFAALIWAAVSTTWSPFTPKTRRGQHHRQADRRAAALLERGLRGAARRSEAGATGARRPGLGLRRPWA